MLTGVLFAGAKGAPARAAERQIPVSRSKSCRTPSRCYGPGMAPYDEALALTAEPSHVPSGAALLAIELSEIARGIRGLDVLRRSIDRAPPA